MTTEAVAELQPVCEPPPVPAPRMIEGPVSVLGIVSAAAWKDTGGKFDLQQVLFGREGGVPFAIASDSKMMARVAWDDDEPQADVAPFGIPDAAVRMLLRQLALFPAQRDRLRFRVEAGQDDMRELSLLIVSDTLPVLSAGVRAKAPGKWPLAILPDFTREVQRAQQPDLTLQRRIATNLLSRSLQIIESVTSESGLGDSDCALGLIGTRIGSELGKWTFQFGGDIEPLKFGVHGWIIAMPLTDDPPVRIPVPAPNGE